MKLSTKTRYGVRAVFDIAFHNSGRPTQARDIARRQDVPLRYLEQIFQELRRGNLVEAKRGPKGGYYLARSADRITIGDVVRAVQGPIDLFAADDEPPENPRANGTPQSIWPTIWGPLAKQIEAVFDGVTIKDLCQRGDSLGMHRGESGPHMYFI